ncbi:hypothetical protein GDO86_020437 [Hymenochirus boettgeri]|uniref:Ig-like domain-containing protein n=1 Tax=Hymenochirus boettgeri TaxID=247094 RepID=A0A8T2IHI9_9PIPI|nr:hypothetical protein GDO86_020437 [Hymenochirus boettgeri]
MEVNAPSMKEALVGSEVLLPCTFLVDTNPVSIQFLAIYWYFGDKEIVRYNNKGKVTNHPRVTINEKAALGGNVSLTLSAMSITDEGAYTCLVIYSPHRQEKVIKLKALAVPGVSVEKRTLIKDQESVLQCSVTDFYPESITVTWLRNGKPLGGSVLGMFQRNADGTYRMNSTVTLSPSDTLGSPVIGCQVEHDSLPKPMSDSYKVKYGASPSLRVFSSKFDGRQDRIFVCEASGFYPEPVELKWVLDGKEVAETNLDRGFIKESYLWMSPGEGNRLTNITCQVSHETLVHPVSVMQSLPKSECPSPGCAHNTIS